MALLFPITLSGNTSGERHRQLNCLVTDAYRSSIPFTSIQHVRENSPIHRFFKIDLASKYKDVDYIVLNLMDADMLYVSRALKCTWLLDPQYSDIINPNYLENELFPEMTTTAINKMKHWIHDHLQDPERCRIFYERYKNSEFQLAMKFLRKCTNEYVLEEFKTIQTRVTPKQLKIFSEKCPELTKIFYEQIKHNRDLLIHYLENEEAFLNNLKYLLKADPDTFFDILEKYYSIQRNRSFRSDITKHIMVHHRDKFYKKPELYTVHLLDMNAIAKCISPEEAKDLILKLAHAAYLEHWFTYKTVEPLILRLDKDERVALRQMIFVNKELGDKIKDWPYDLPTSPVLEKEPEYSLFSETIHNPRYYGSLDLDQRKACKKRKKALLRLKKNTLFEQLFEHYQFATFENTFFELRTRLRSENSPKNRQTMILVLISMSGGQETSLRPLFELLTQYKYESVHWRADIVRKLVKLAFAWRLPEDLWRNLLEWGYDLGLDGSRPKTRCDEGLHAVVLRDLLANKPSTPSVLHSFLNRFSYFTHFPLDTSERCCVKTRLRNLLMAEADEARREEQLDSSMSMYWTRLKSINFLLMRLLEP